MDFSISFEIYSDHLPLICTESLNRSYVIWCNSYKNFIVSLY